MSTSKKSEIIKDFQQATKSNQKREVAIPFSIRFTPSEKAHLQSLAGNQYLGAYIRSVLFESKVQKRCKSRKPKINDAKLAQVLAALGSSRLASNLNQIAKGANLGTIPFTEDLTDDLIAACADVKAMRRDLITALGLCATE